MEEKMEKALLECCEKHAEVLSQEVIDFIYDLANTAIQTSETVIDDAFLGIINSTKPVLEAYVSKLVDKIHNEENS